MTPPLGPPPPLEPQSIAAGPITGDPVIPSPTTGSSSALMRPIQTGQCARNGLGPARFGPPGSPPGLIAYSRPFASFNGLAPEGSQPHTPIAGSELHADMA